jgi:hypothetical protein
VDVAKKAGIDFGLSHHGKSPLNIMETLGCGCAFLDYDNDGWLDVFLVGQPTSALFRNKGDGTFENVTAQSGITRPSNWMGCAVGDYDNDGYPDLFVTGYGDCALYHNNARNRDGHGAIFTEVTQQAGIVNHDWTTSAAFADADGDGWLDLYVASYVEFNEKTIQTCTYRGVPSACGPRFYDAQKGRFYRNVGNGRFVEATKQFGFDTAHGKGLGVIFSDYDNDGKIDLYVANDETPADHFRNRGNGKFENVGVLVGTAYDHDGQVQGGMGVDFGDYDNDGDLDLIVGTFHLEPNSLYQNDGKGGFAEVSVPAGIAEATLRHVAFSVRFFDYNHDGWLDLLITNGHVQDNVHKFDASTHYAQPMQLFRNRRDGRFEEVTRLAGAVFQRRLVGRGAAFGDYDNDGDVDVLVSDLEGPALLLQNQIGNQRITQYAIRRNWLIVDCIGTQSNRDAIGARVTLNVGGKKRLAEVQRGVGYMSASDKRVHFGLGDARTVERVEVRFPSGRVVVRKNVKVNQVVTIKEDEG